MPYCKVPRFCGIYYITDTLSWLPYVSLSTNSSIQDTASRTKLTQTFVNPSKTDAIRNAKYTFPLYESCAVVSFSCFVGKRLIEGVVREKGEARVEYNEALARGETAGLLEQHTPDVFSTSLGNIPAGEIIKVEVEYIMELKHDAEVDGLRFTIPTSIAPRYGDAPSGVSTSGQGQPIPGALEEGGMQISVKLTMPSNIRSVQSSSHTLAIHLGGHEENVADDAFNPKHALATLSQTSIELGADFVLLVKCADLSSPRALLETHPTINNSKALMVTLVPKFTLPPGPKPEVVFVVDRSGSMGGRMKPLKSALAVFLKSLPLGVKFNICSFGSDHSFLWNKSQSYTADTLDMANKHVASMEANLGGTELLPPIQATVSRRYKDLSLEIMVLTDGEVWNTQEIFEYIEQETATGEVRLFSLGIGRDVSHSLVEGIARVGRGFAQIVSDENEGLEGKVVRMLKGGLSAHIKDYRLEWEGRPSEDETKASARETSAPLEGDVIRKVKKLSLFKPDTSDTPIQGSVGRFADLPEFLVPTVIQAPYKLPPLFPFSRSTAYAILSGDIPAPLSVWLRGTTLSGDELELELPVQNMSEQAQTIHQLAARKILQELEEGTGYIHSGKYGVDKEQNAGTFGDWVDREGTRVGVTYGLASKWTSFVAVDKTTDKELETATKTRDYEELHYEALYLVDKAASAPGGQAFGSSSAFSMASYAIPPPPPMVQVGGGSAYMNAPIPPASLPISHRPKMKMKKDSAALPHPELIASLSALPSSSGENYLEMCEEQDDDMGQDDDMSLSLFGDDAPEKDSASADFTHLAQSNTAVASTPMEPRERTKALIALQTFEGSFQLTAAFAIILGVTLTDLEAKFTDFVFPVVVNLTEVERKTLWATVLAVRMFEGNLKGEMETWELVVEKARAWIVSLVGMGDLGGVKRLEELAGEAL